MRSLYILLIIVLACAFSCQHVTKAPKPDKLISEKEMVSILVDLVKLDAAVSYSGVEITKRKVSLKELLYKKYQVDSTQLADNIAYYTEDVAVSERVFNEVKKILDEEQQAVDSLKTNSNTVLSEIEKASFESLKLDSLRVKDKETGAN